MVQILLLRVHHPSMQGSWRTADREARMPMRIPTAGSSRAQWRSSLPDNLERSSSRHSDSMRLWSLHPKYLDPAGLVALWRESLLAQAVLRGATRGYRHHPQLERFRGAPSPEGSIAEYLGVVHDDSVRRGYRFDASKKGAPRDATPIMVTDGQLAFEWRHLLAKLRERSHEHHQRLRDVAHPEAHPLFRVVEGGIATWERAAGGA
jgi:hypothetical protein